MPAMGDLILGLCKESSSPGVGPPRRCSSAEWSSSWEAWTSGLGARRPGRRVKWSRWGARGRGRGAGRGRRLSVGVKGLAVEEEPRAARLQPTRGPLGAW
jgi:hypothetical protein